MKTTKILSIMLAIVMIASMLTLLPVTAAEDAYTAAKDGDLLYTVKYDGTDDFYKPSVVNQRMGVKVDPTDSTIVTLTNLNTAKDEVDWWGGRVENLPLNENTKYTIYVDVARPVLEGGTIENTSFGIYFDNCVGFYGYNNQLHWTHDGTDLGPKSHPYVKFADAAITPKSDLTTTTETQHIAIEINGSNYTCAGYIMNDKGEYQLVDRLVEGELEFFRDDCLNIVYYIYSKGRTMTLSNTKIYKGLKIGGSDTTAHAPEYVNISNALELAAIETGKNYKLTADIDLGGMKLTAPLIAEFSGIIDGQGHTIKNFSIDATGNVDFGLILSLAKTGDVIIKNLNIGTSAAPISAKYVLTADSKSIGILGGACANRNYATKIENVNIYANFEVPTAKKCNVGGFIGYARLTYFKDCSFNGSLTVGDLASTTYANAAGFIGSNNNCNWLRNCVNNAAITVKASTSEARAAGITAYTGNATVITDCVNNGKIKCDTAEGDSTVDTYLAGILADANGVPVKLINCVNKGDVEVASTSEKARTAGICCSFKKNLSQHTVYHCTNDAKIASAAITGNLAAGLATDVVVNVVNVPPVPTGDSFVIFAGIAVVAVLGMCVTLAVSKKRRENV